MEIWILPVIGLVFHLVRSFLLGTDSSFYYRLTKVVTLHCHLIHIEISMFFLTHMHVKFGLIQLNFMRFSETPYKGLCSMK